MDLFQMNFGQMDYFFEYLLFDSMYALDVHYPNPKNVLIHSSFEVQILNYSYLPIFVVDGLVLGWIHPDC